MGISVPHHGERDPSKLRARALTCGRFAAKIFHISFIRTSPSLELQAIVQRHPTSQSSAPVDYPEVKHYLSAEELVEDSSCDIVVITTPPNTHYDLAKLCLEARKHILVEKPFVSRFEDAEHLTKLASDVGRLICVYQNRRFDSDFLAVHKLVQDGVFGWIHEIDTHFDYYRPDSAKSWRGQLSTTEGGGALFDLGSHLIDQAYTLFGLPCSVYGRLLNQKRGCLDLMHPDSVHAQLNYADGMIVNIRISDMSVESPQRRFWIRGTKASFKKDGMDPQEAQLESEVQTLVLRGRAVRGGWLSSAKTAQLKSSVTPLCVAKTVALCTMALCTKDLRRQSGLGMRTWFQYPHFRPERSCAFWSRCMQARK